MATKSTAAPSPAAPGSAAMDAWVNLVVSHSRLMSALDEELRAEHGSTMGDYDVFVQLSRAPGGRLRMCDLASAVLLSPSGLSRRVERLERAGLVQRRRSDDDARSIEAALTDEGKRYFRRLRKTHRAGVRERFADRFSEEELETLAGLLSRLTGTSEPDSC